ncbi:MAG: glutamate formimidoyltransferase [Candidatus Aminicenantes bacterium RBG_13_63_10]|nr:MAG: glutamate formimidoyltransferase [Candidatus Aminicenantes bacterium RBG_13_63_10]
MKLVECVPNFSEGRDRSRIDAITREIQAVEGAKLLDVDPGETTNRTVVTFVGTPEAAAEAAFRAIRKAAEVIDMRQHKGAHSRIGATDVCPFVPLSGATMEDCVRLARELGRRVAQELGIPVYFYEEAALIPERKNLAVIRSGEYEGLSEKLKDPAWAPDCGTAEFNPRSGATIIGAREFLIAYNINLNTRDRKLANEIAFSLRETGRVKKDARGNTQLDAQGRPLRVPGLFQHVKAVGWYIEDYGRAQISINFTNYKVSPPHLVFDEAVRLASKLGLRVTGSELVGLIPKEALLMAGRHYLEKQGHSPGVPEEELVRTAVLSLGLSDVVPFDPRQKIIEYQLGGEGPSLLKMDLRRFLDELSMESPTPGGGSVAALCGSLSAALSSMVSHLTVGKKGYESVQREVKRLAVEAQGLKDSLLEDVDRDTRAFNKVIDALRLPKKSEEQSSERDRAVETASLEATLVPLAVLEKSIDLLKLARKIAKIGNKNSLSDAGVAGLTAVSAAEGAYYNVRINLPSLRNEKQRAAIGVKAKALRNRALKMGDDIRRLMDKGLRRL